MKPGIQCVRTRWKSGSSASGSGPIFMINLAKRQGAPAAWERGSTNNGTASGGSELQAAGLPPLAVQICKEPDLVADAPVICYGRSERAEGPVGHDEPRAVWGLHARGSQQAPRGEHCRLGLRLPDPPALPATMLFGCRPGVSCAGAKGSCPLRARSDRHPECPTVTRESTSSDLSPDWLADRNLASSGQYAGAGCYRC
jgi:hypothetical protein